MDPERTAAKPRPQPTSVSEASSSGSGDAWGTYFLGPYRVVDEIGVGGMATVELGRMDGAGGFQKWVAIKRIHPHLTEDQQFINMFLDEARIAASISHPNVAQVFDLGKDQNTYWIAMEYLHGEPLREIMRINEETGLSVRAELAARMIADAAEGLHAAHELRGKDGEPLNLVHRDVTPHNLFITYDGVVKVVDFGIAKVAGSLSNTHAGTIKGKVAYMAPEQVRGKPIDRRTDVFALGVVLWEMTTGRRLFRVESDLGTLSRVEACVVPPPSVFNEDYPEELEGVLLKALQREPVDRYQSARELSRALQKYLMGANAFVGPEEISVYVKSMFNDRIRKREDHLRWAAEVTQTISIRKALTQEEPGDLLDLSKLPRESSESESLEFDTIREQPAPNVRGVPSPLGPDSTTQRSSDPLGQTMQETPAAREALDRQERPSVTEAVAVRAHVHHHEAKVVVPEPADDEEDEAETLIATAPQVLAGMSSLVGKGRHEPANEDLEPDSVSSTQAYVRSDPVIDSVERKEPAPRPQEPWPPVGAAAPPPANWVPPPGTVFDKHSSPAAETIQLQAVRTAGVSPLVVFAAAVGAGFVAAGLGAIWWVRNQPEPIPAPAPSAIAATASIVPTMPTAKLTAVPPATMTGSLPAPSRHETPTARPNEDRKAPRPPATTPDLPTDVRPGFLSVHCNPTCDTIVAGGQTFSGSISKATMPPGQYRVRCVRGDVTKVLSVIVVSDEHVSQGIKMD